MFNNLLNNINYNPHLMDLQYKFLMNDATQNLNNTFNNGAKAIAGVALAFGGLIIAWGGILYESGGQESIRKAKQKWISAAVGMVVVFGATVIASYIKNNMGF